LSERWPPLLAKDDLLMDEPPQALSYETPPPKARRKSLLGFIGYHVSCVWLLVVALGIWMDRAYAYFLSHDPQGVWGSPNNDHYTWVGFELPLTIVLVGMALLGIVTLAYVARDGILHLSELVLLSINGVAALFVIFLISCAYSAKFYP
jgi:hypothetical protein